MIHIADGVKSTVILTEFRLSEVQRNVLLITWLADKIGSDFHYVPMAMKLPHDQQVLSNPTSSLKWRMQNT